MASLVNKPDHGTPIGTVDGKPVVLNEVFQAYFDALELLLNAKVLGQSIRLETYTVATLPPVPNGKPGLIFVSDETGGAVPAFSDGTNWRRCTDRAIVS